MMGVTIGEITLVEAAWNTIDGVWWLIFLALSILFFYKDKIGRYLLLVFVSLWAIIQFFNHWSYTIFGVSKEKLVSYNEFFKDTYHIIPASNEILIPDFYHIILHILILLVLYYLISYNIRRKELEKENDKMD
jgi:hypothetical protein